MCWTEVTSFVVRYVVAPGATLIFDGGHAKDEDPGEIG
jgi:hypothetical protein